MSEHHPRGMSKWPAITECNCYESADGGADADLGTRTHAYLAEVLTAWKQTGEMPDHDEERDVFEHGAYKAALLIRDCMIARNVHPEALHVEERVTLEDGIFGTADVWYTDGQTLFVWDFKTVHNSGRDYTAQLAGYALGIRQQMELTGVKHPPAEASLRVVYGDGHKVDETLLSVYEMQYFYEKAMQAFDNAGTEARQCNWCPLCAKREGCATYRAVAEAVSSRADIVNAPVNWNDLTRETKAQLLVLAETVCKWAEAVREKAKADLMSGASIEDDANGIRYCLRSVSSRKTPRTAEACKMLMGKGVSADEIRGELTMSAASVKKLLKGAGLKGKAIEEALSAVCDVGAGTVQMVRG